MKQKPLRFFLLLILSLLTVCASGCAVRRPSEVTITMYADKSLENGLTSLADDFYRDDRVKVEFNFDTTPILAHEIREGKTADLMALEGERTMHALQWQQHVDNYRLFTVDRGAGADVFAVAKPIRGNHRAEAQRFADLMLAESGRKRLAAGRADDTVAVKAGLYKRQCV